MKYVFSPMRLWFQNVWDRFLIYVVVDLLYLFIAIVSGMITKKYVWFALGFQKYHGDKKAKTNNF